MVGRFISAHAGNYQVGRTDVKTKVAYKPEFIIIHTMDGYYNGSIAWFQNPDCDASAHFLISKAGEITQMIKESDTAYQATNYNINLRSIGIEHEDEKKPHEFIRPDELYNSSAELVEDISYRHNIPLDRQHILKHSEIFSGKTCPGTLNIDRIISQAQAIRTQRINPTPAQPQPTYAITPHNRNVVVTPDKGLNIRSAPTTTAKNITRVLTKNTSITVEGYVIGESVAGVNVWWKVKDKNEFAWAGATNFIPSPAPSNPAAAPQPATPEPTQMPDPIASVNPEELKVKISALEEQVKIVTTNWRESSKFAETLKIEKEKLEEKLLEYGNQNFETVKTANEILTGEKKELLRKNKELADQRDDAYIKAFEGWSLYEVPEGARGTAVVLSLLARLLKFSNKKHYVVGWKEGAKLYRTDGTPDPVAAQDATAKDLNPAA